jgi:hypothetical protein
MKNLLALALTAAALSTAVAQTSVGISIGINQPGVYGQINIGNLPPPPVVYAQPIIYAPPRVAVVQQPVYLYVPPGHQKNWGKYCGKYQACGQPVYFVQESWVRERYESEGQHGHGNGKNKGGQGNGKGKGHD